MQIRKNRSAFLFLVFILFGIYCFVLGDSGILERVKLSESKDKIKENISRLARENDRLKKEYSVISNSRTNQDFYKKEASKSGYIAPGEKYLFLKSSSNGEANKVNIKTTDNNDKYTVDISHLRILWIFASVMIMLLYFWKRNKEKEDAV